MESIWTLQEASPEFKTLSEDINTDVLIIGGGITGILCAYMLKQSGIDYALAEAGKICGGITKNTTAKITCQHGLIYDDIINRYGSDAASLYYKAQNEAVNKYRELSKNTDCDFIDCDSVVYTLDDKGKIEREIDALNKIGCPSVYTKDLPLPFSVKGAVKLKNQAQFNPLKFIFSIAKDLNIYENTKVTELVGNTAITNNGKINAKKIIVTTHFPFINKHGGYFLKMYQHRSYVIAVKNAFYLKDMYVDESQTGMSFRGYKDMLLIGGGGHRTGKTGGNWKELSDFIREHYPEAKGVYRWATQDCMTLDGIPYVGRYSKNTPTLYVATGFNKWGMTSAMVASMILSDLVCDRQNEYAEIFSPDRSIFHPQLAVNIGEALKGVLTPTTPRCPHLGCALKYNRQEHTWDCSCHGSRFTDSGEVIDNPATDDIAKKEEY